MKPRNPILFFLFIIFIIVNLLDLITAYFILPGESNPLFLLTNSYLSIIALKIIIIYIVWLIYRRNIYNSHFNYYLILIIITLGIFLMSLGLYNNIRGMLEPNLIQQAANVTTGVKVKAYFMMTAFIYLIPLLFSIFTFKLYEWSLKYIIIKKR
jgi:hypothetical protein